MSNPPPDLITKYKNDKKNSTATHNNERNVTGNTSQKKVSESKDTLRKLNFPISGLKQDLIGRSSNAPQENENNTTQEKDTNIPTPVLLC